VRRQDIGRAKQCRRCHNSQIAPLGYAATKAKYGPNFALQFVRDYRLSHASNLEQIVTRWLDGQDVCYEREYWLETADRAYLVDFLILPAKRVQIASGDKIMAGCVAIEVNGWHHQYHAERDRRKAAALKAEGFTVIELSEADVLTGAFVGRLAVALGRRELSPATDFHPSA
jgi:hypothetical protein